MRNRLLSTDRNGGEKGTVFVFVVVALLVLFAFAAFAIDVGHYHVVNNEIQNAADAVALAGASALYPNSPPTEPNFSQARIAATNAITLNKSDNVNLTNCEVQTGYWDLSQNMPGLQSSLPGGVTLGGNWVPAVMAKVSRADGQNNGPMTTSFASILGINSLSTTKEAVAVVAFPSGVNSGPLLPFAVNKTLVDRLVWQEPPVSFRIGSAYHYPDSQAGQWTSFLIDSSDVPTVRNLIENGNPTPININDPIYIEPGTKNTLYDSETQWSVDTRRDQTVCLPIVDAILRDGVKDYVPVVGFIPFYIEYATGGNDKYVQGHFLPGSNACAGGAGGGPNYGAVLPPRITR